MAVAGTIFGDITDEETGEYLEGVKFRLYYWDGSSPWHKFFDDGIYDAPAFSGGGTEDWGWHLDFIKPGYEPGQLRGIKCVPLGF